MVLPSIVTVCAGLSALGDLVVIATWRSIVHNSSRNPVVRANFSVRYVAYLAIANLVASSVGLANGFSGDIDPDGLCSFLGVVVWWGSWSTWWWTTAIALAFRHCFVSASASASLDLSATRETIAHAVCWGAPVLQVGVAYVSGNSFGELKGPSHALRNCGFNSPDSSDEVPYVFSFVLVEGALGVLVLANVAAFVSAHRVLSGTVALASEHGLLDEHAARRVTRLWWPTFTAYISVFVLSQAPGALVNVLAAAGAPVSDSLAVATDALAYSHGWMNAVVYGLCNKALFRQWSECSCCSPRRLLRGRSTRSYDLSRASDMPPPPSGPSTTPATGWRVGLSAGR